MRPKTYCKFSRQCQNCKFIAISKQTSFLAKKGSATFHCTKNDPVPKYPEIKPLKDHPSLLGRISDDDRTNYDRIRRSWSRRTKVQSDGSCGEHKFVGGA